MPTWGTPKFERPNSSKLEKEKLTFCKQVKAVICNSF